MKKIFAALLSLCLVLSAAGCSAQDSADGASSAGASAETQVNQGELKTGVYTGSASYSEGEFSMDWNMVLDFQEDNTFVLSNDTGAEKGSGTYALTDSCYTMTYSDERTCTFVVLEDGTLKLTSDLPFGKAAIGLEEVGGIVLNYHGESYDFAAGDTDASAGVTADTAASVAAGTYAASYTKESKMAGTVVYNYTAQLSEDGSFSYAVTFDMKGTAYDGSSASGTYAVEGGKFTFTDSEGNVTEGTVTAENTFVIALKASEMASDPYEVTFAPAA